MGRQENRDALPAELVDKPVDATGGDRIQPGRRLVEEQHLGIAEQRPRQRDPLAQPFGQRAARVFGSVSEIDGSQRAVDPLRRGG